MATPGIVNNLSSQTANQSNYLSWSRSAGATSYNIYRDASESGTYSLLDTSAVPHYLDTSAAIATSYSYYVTAVNASGEGLPSSMVGPLIPAPTGEMALATLRLAAQQKADRPASSQFVTLPEWNTFINLAMKELYDILITVYEDYFIAPRVQFVAPGNQSIFPLPNGTLQFNSAPNQGPLFTAAPFYKLLGVDLGLQTYNNAFVTVTKYMLINRNNFVFPNTSSSLYGVFNLQYRLMGTNIEFIPQPSGGQLIQLLYIPRLPDLIQDTDITTIGFSGWLEYVIIRAAMYALQKEESDITNLSQELMFVQKRIEETAPNKDAGMPDRISDIRGSTWGSGSGNGPGSPSGGF